MCQPTRSEMDLSYAGLVGCSMPWASPPWTRFPHRRLRCCAPSCGWRTAHSRSIACRSASRPVAAMRAVACDRPLVIAVDDSQWLDQPTARILSFLVRRLAARERASSSSAASVPSQCFARR